jgi:hypothetical protein
MADTEAHGRTIEDTHFYIDNAPPTEVIAVLRVLSTDAGMTPDEIASAVERDGGFQMQRDHTYSPRRLADIGVASQARSGTKVIYTLPSRGARLQGILGTSESLVKDILHYLHYSSFAWRPQDRKYLWSYRRCCQHTWARSAVVPPRELSAVVQEEMRSEFPGLDFGSRVGARFNSTAASCVTTWLRALEPSPISESTRRLCPRTVDRYELALLSLDDLYRSRHYRYGDPVLLDDAVVDEMASVFLLDKSCCLELLHLAARLSPVVVLSDTLAGPSVNLLKAYTVDDL